MKSISIGIMCLALCAVPAIASTLVVGAPADSGTGNCFPFGCAYSGEYQQVYNSTQFSGPITITSLDFYNTQVDFGTTSMNSGDFTLSLSTTSANWNSLSSTFSANTGSDDTTVFSGSLAQPWAFGDTLTIGLTTPFTYNPGSGNLLLDVVTSGTSDAGGAIYFDTNGYNGGNFNGNDYLGRVYNSGTVNGGYGLATGFGEGSPTVTPEPSSLLLLGSGLVGLMGMMKRKLCR